MDNEYLLPARFRDMSRAQRALAASDASVAAHQLERTLHLLRGGSLDFEVLALGVDPDVVMLDCMNRLSEQRRIAATLDGSY